MPSETPDDRCDPDVQNFEGATWHHRNYFIYSPKWDHDHCEYCSIAFEAPGSKAATGRVEVVTSGWTCEDEYHWVCEACFAKNQAQFDWRVRGRERGDRVDTPPEEADRVHEELKKKHSSHDVTR